jgi:hypothetical protein
MPDETAEAMRDASRRIEDFLSRHGSPTARLEAPIPDLEPVSEAVDRVSRSLQRNPPSRDLDQTAMTVALERLQPKLEARRDALRERLGKVRQALHWVDSFHQTRD